MRLRPTRFAATAALLCFVAAAALAQRPQTVSGTVSRVQAQERMVVVAPEGGGDPVRVEWNSETRITGTLAPGARVTVRYVPQEDGKNVAQQITVSRG
jgi:hypothetical protein